jgi:putative tricarboxylic transport membrane protein
MSDVIKTRDWIPAMVWFIFGSVIAFQAYKLDIGDLHTPGAGMLPFILGVILVLLSVPIFVYAYRGFRKRDRKEDNVWERLDFRKMGISVLALIFYGFALDKVGFTLTVLITMFVLFKVVGSTKWYKILLLSCLTAFFSYLLFVIVLEVQFPSFPARF